MHHLIKYYIMAVPITPKLFIPGITGADLKDFSLISNNSESGLYYVSFIVVWRAQMAANLSTTLSPAEIQSLSSMRYAAKKLSSIKKIRMLAATVAINRSIAFDLPALKSLGSNKERFDYLNSQALELVNGKPPRGIKILSPSQINDSNLINHRFAIMAKLFGLWQSKPIYDPASILKGGAIASVDSATVIQCFNTTSKLMLGDDAYIADESNLKYLNISLFPKATAHDETGTPTHWSSDESEITEFNDGVNLTRTNNILPIEEGLTMVRKIPQPFEMVSLPPEQVQDPLLNRAMEQGKLFTRSNAARVVPPPRATRRTGTAVSPSSESEPTYPRPPSPGRAGGRGGRGGSPPIPPQGRGASDRNAPWASGPPKRRSR
jgi:hypothetical protein